MTSPFIRPRSPRPDYIVTAREPSRRAQVLVALVLLAPLVGAALWLLWRAAAFDAAVVP